MSDGGGDGGDVISWERLDDPRVVRLVGVLAFGLVLAALVLVDRPLGLLYPLSLVGAGILLARRSRGSPVALAGCAGIALGGVLQGVAALGLGGVELAAEALALVGFVVFLLGR